MVMRAICSNVRGLLDYEVGRTTATPTERLARAQALFIYQVMRLFDENITLRSQAEKDMHVLDAWLAELCKIRDNLGNLENDAARHQKSVEWEVRIFLSLAWVEVANQIGWLQRWIFAESVRRTIVMAYSVMVLYEMMKETDTEDGMNPIICWYGGNKTEIHIRGPGCLGLYTSLDPLQTTLGSQLLLRVHSVMEGHPAVHNFQLLVRQLSRAWKRRGC